MDEIAFEDWTRRDRWGTPPAFGSRPKLAAVIHHAVTDITGDDALEQIQEIEEVIYSRRFDAGFSMFAYNHAVDRAEANWHHGRGWVNGNGANNNDRGPTGRYPALNNSNTISIVLAGNYEPNVPGVPTLAPTEAQLRTVAHIIRTGRELGHLTDNCLVIPHNALHATGCPGDHLEAQIPTILDYLAQDQGDNSMPYTDLPGEAQADFLRAVGLGISTGSDPNGYAERDEATVMAVRAYDAAEAMIKAEVSKINGQLTALRAELAKKATTATLAAVQAQIAALTANTSTPTPAAATGPHSVAAGSTVTIVAGAGGAQLEITP